MIPPTTAIKAIAIINNVISSPSCTENPSYVAGAAWPLVSEQDAPNQPSLQ
jgi:hypothetical protein